MLNLWKVSCLRRVRPAVESRLSRLELACAWFVLLSDFALFA